MFIIGTSSSKHNIDAPFAMRRLYSTQSMASTHDAHLISFFCYIIFLSLARVFSILVINKKKWKLSADDGAADGKKEMHTQPRYRVYFQLV